MLGCSGFLADAVGQHLIHADAAVNDRAFLNRHAGKQVAGLAGMNAHADGRFVEQAVDDVDLLLHRLQGLERFAEFHVRRPAPWPTSDCR